MEPLLKGKVKLKYNEPPFKSQQYNKPLKVRATYGCCHNAILGRAKANGREPESCLGQVFNFKLDCFCCACTCIA